MSLKYVKKASISPYFQNGLQKSPLGFLRFPFSRAFSHKELLGHFDPYLDFIVKMTKCRPVVHPDVPAKCAPDTPDGPVSKLTPGTISSSGLARSPSGILNDMVFNGFAPDYD